MKIINRKSLIFNHASLIFNRILISFLIITVLFESVVPTVALAQETATSSAAITTPSPEDSEFEKLKSKLLITESLKDLNLSQDSTSSQIVTLKSKVRTLVKKTFRSTEKIPIIVENEDPSKVQVEIFSFDGEKVLVEIESEKIANTAVLRVVPPAHFKPGRYQMKVTDSKGSVSTQDFTWGVLAINTHKSIYTPNETAKIFMGVLDETGNMVCEASLNLEIKDPQGNISTLSTNDKSIKMNPACYGRTFTMEPDFETTYTVREIGTHDMTLTAVTKNGSYTITDSFQVQESVPFDVERVTATRIFPPIQYPVEFLIKANQDFEGEISEVVPESFQVENAEGFQPIDEIKIHSVLPKEFAKSFTIAQPFKGNFIASQGFGSEETDAAMASKYKKYGLIGHDGIDFPLASGTPVIAADEGVIAQAKENGDYGTTIVIQHTWGRSYYGHLSKIEAPFGTKVLKGQQIGLSGNTGLLTTGPHLHFGIKLISNDPSNGYYGKVNPIPYFNSPQEVIAKLTTFEALRKNHAMGVQIIKWKVNIKKGDEIKLGYKYLAPPQSPQFYTLGPLSFTSKDQDGFPDFVESRKWQIAVDATTTVFVTSGATWSVPTNWSNVNTIEVIGGGGGGCGHASGNGNGGGGGGAYAKITNLTLTPSASINISVGAAGSFRGDGGDTWFNGGTCAGASVCADGGLGSIAAAGGTGGTTGNSVGTTLYKGGDGGTGDGAADSQGGGGGAGGPNGAGGAGGFGDNDNTTDGVGGGGGGNGGRTTTGGYVGGDGRVSDTVGADGGNNFNNDVSSGGTGGSPGEAGVDGGGGGGGSDAQAGGNGGNGIDWDATHGSGGGGGGAGDMAAGITGGKGGLYGGGGGGGSNSGGQGVGAQGIIVITYTINTAPNTPSQDSPSNNATGVSVTPTFTMTATDPDSDKISYKVTIYSESSCTSVVQTNDQAVSSTGWTGTNTTCTAAPTACYTSGTQGSYLTQSSLTGGTQYWWKASAKDPDNTAAFTDSSTCNNFTTGSSGPTLNQILRHGVWFSGGTEQPFTF